MTKLDSEWVDNRPFDSREIEKFWRKKKEYYGIFEKAGAPNENIVQNHINITLLNVL